MNRDPLVVGEPWRSIGSAESIYEATYAFPGGRSRTTVLQLTRSSWLAYSPGAKLVDAATELIPRDSKLYLLVPSSSHLLGVDAWLSRFSNAVVVATDVAAERLTNKTDATHAVGLGVLAEALPSHVSCFAVPSSRTGEVWLALDVDAKRYWVVCDLLMNIRSFPQGRLVRLLMWLYGLRRGLTIAPSALRGISDQKAFQSWALEAFSSPHQHALIPCHGEVDEGSDFSNRVARLLHERLRL